jgi:hypothetical protein
MPKYTFVCSECGASDQRYVPKLVKEIECSICSKLAIRQLPTLNGPSSVTEVIDKYTGITHRRDQKEEVTARKEEYFWTVEVPRFVASGTYSLETMLENGWVWVDDNLQVHIHNKPPHRR